MVVFVKSCLCLSGFIEHTPVLYVEQEKIAKVPPDRVEFALMAGYRGTRRHLEPSMLISLDCTIVYLRIKARLLVNLSPIAIGGHRLGSLQFELGR